jgi:hypothetical protein
MTDFSDWRTFDYQRALVQLWVFKDSKTLARFRAWHVRTDEEIENIFRDVLKSETDRIAESLPYTALSQNNDNSCLLHSLNESAGLASLLVAVNAPEAENTIAQLKQLQGASGYLVKFQRGRQTVYAVKKTAPAWKPKVRSKLINTMFVDGELSAVPSESFTFETYFDFYCLNGTILVASRRAYESTVSDKTIYRRSFDDLVADNNFAMVVSDIEPLKRFVGENTTHLKRMTAIKQKALYARPGFTERVKVVSEARNWGIRFDSQGRIVICENTARVVMQVFLDHRLFSEVTETIYDVPDAEAV